MSSKIVTKLSFYFITLLGVISLLNYSCEYAPDEINFVKKDSTITNYLTINLDDLPGDTILIVQPTSITLKAQADEGEYIQFFVRVNGPESFNPPYYSFPNSTFSFEINPRYRTSGIYHLNITARSATGTGSLREKLGGEALVATIEKVLIFDNSPVEKIGITSVVEEDGSVIVRWPKYPHQNLKAITVWREIDYTHGVDKKSFTISPNQTYYKDSSYVGESARYYLQSETYDGNILLGEPFAFTGRPSPVIQAFQTLHGTTTVDIKWNKLHYSSNFKSYKLYETGVEPPLATITDISDTSFALSNYVKFGEFKKFHVVTESFGGTSIYKSSTEIYPGDKTAVTGYDQLFFSSNTQRVYYFESYQQRLGVAQDNVLTTQIGMSYSYNRPFKLIISHDGATVFVHNAGLAQYDPANLVYLRGYLEYCMAGRITNDNLVIYSVNDTNNCHPDPNRPPGLLLYNYEQDITLDVLTTYSDVATAPPITFTEVGYDERSVLVKNENEFRLATFNDTQFITDEHIGIPTNFEAHFIPFDNDKIYGFNSTQSMVYAIGSGQLTVRSLGETILLPRFDYERGWVGGLSNDLMRYVIFDITTGQKIKEIDIQSASFNPNVDLMNPTTFYLSDGRLYTKPGYILYLDEE